MLTLDRRTVLSAAMLGAPAVATRRGWKPACPYPVNAAPDRLIRSVVGLRPYRPQGFRVEREAIGAGRTIVHNYGHGGGGITLSWGTARLAVDLGLPGHAGRVAVIGAGAVGLATARLAQEAGYDVTLYAAVLPPGTTSDVAGGQWYPASVYRRADASPAFVAQLVAASNAAYRRFQTMTGARYGVRWMRNYLLSDAPFDDGREDPVAPMMPQARVLSRAENPFPAPHVRQWDSLIVEPPVFLRQMLEDVRIAGGRVVVRRFASMAEIAALPETLVFNCTGLGARDLVGDTSLVPIRGQLAIVEPQPEVDYAMLSGDGLYMFSRSDGVVLGGTHEAGQWDTTPDPAVTARILAGHARVFDHMRCRPRGPRPLLS